MEFSTDLKAIIRCHQANDHFDRRAEITFNPTAPRFSAANAWWLAEISRWMYVGKRLPVTARHRPQTILNAAGLEETHYLTRGGTHCSLIRSAGREFSILVFRGTCQLNNWVTNANIGPFKDNAHRGYEQALDQVWDDVSTALAESPGQIFFTGHSMGGALATLAARRFQPAGVYSFGSPPIGNAALAAEFNQLPIYRMVNFKDAVCRIPFQQGHVGQLCYLSQDHSLLLDPDPEEIRADRAIGQRQINRELNRNKKLAIPDFLCDHAPQNYIANLERLCLGYETELSNQESDALMV